ncbi:NRDE family protein [Desulfomarina sp.]
MCLLFISFKLTPGYRLVLASNRDEFLHRLTAPLTYIDEDKTILAGRDLQGGGTWLGVNKRGKIAAITNFRKGGVLRSDAPSRGEIIDSYLRNDDSAEEFLAKLQKKGREYNGFNLILGDIDKLFYYTNQGLEKNPAVLEPGFYGLCNHFLDSPWPKLVRGKKLLKPVMVETENVKPAMLFSLLKDSWRPEDNSLPETGVGLEWERLLGSIFIDGEFYGTRSSAVITINDNGEIVFCEKTYHRNKKNDDVVCFNEMLDCL